MIRTKHGTKIEIIALAESFYCDGKETPRVVTENIDEHSVTYGAIQTMNVEYLEPKDEAQRVIEGLRGKKSGQLSFDLERE